MLHVFLSLPPPACLLIPQIAFQVDTQGSDVSATPTVINNFVYFGDWSGFLYKVDAQTGAVSWKKNVTELVWPGGVGATNLLVTRTAATDAGNGNIIIGTQTLILPGNFAGTQGYVVSASYPLEHRGLHAWNTHMPHAPDGG